MNRMAADRNRDHQLVTGNFASETVFPSCESVHPVKFQGCNCMAGQNGGARQCAKRASLMLFRFRRAVTLTRKSRCWCVIIKN